MGNSISKKKAKASLSTNHSPSKVKAFWNFGRMDKFKAAGQKQDEQRKLTVHYTTSQHYQENVFIEGSRPKYLEDLHTEAQEGLKILQQEEHNNGVEFKDDQTASTDSPQQEKDASCQEGNGQLDFDGTADHSITSVSTSSRPVLTRQGSTFKPLNTVKRLDKTKKRTRRTTIMGIPQQVQKELCMGRGLLLQHFPNSEDDNSPGTVVIPTIDGGAPVSNHEGARVHLQNIEALQASRDEQLLRHHIQAVYRDDLLLTRQLGQRTSPMQRPKSLAVPGITTSSSFLQEPQGPVMSISPQATYLSTIIPNAVLPAAIDVIEIDRSRSRRSVRTVSKSSLASASPGSSRSGGGTRDVPPSNNSKWSHSQSSETIVSNSSTISLRGNAPPLHVTDSMNEVTHLNHEEQMSFKSSSSWLSSSTKAVSHKAEQEELSDAGESVRNSQLISRSLSVMKAKLPPAPPRRTYSLHQEKLKQRSRELVETKDLNHLESNGGRINGDVNAKERPTPSSNERKSTHSPVTTFLDVTHSSLTSSPQSPDQDYTDAQPRSGNSSPQNNFERTMSPSSGYSSQSGTPTHSSKDICPTSPGKLKVKPPKPERMGARTSPVVSVSSSLNSLSSATTDPAHLSTQTHTTQSQPPKVSLCVTTEKNKVTPTPSGSVIRDLFNIPPPPKVKAPCPPPPETWAHNKHTVALLCGPGPCASRTYELQKQQQKDFSLSKNQDTTDPTEQTSLERHVSVEAHSQNNEVITEAKNEAMPVQKQMTLDETLAVRHKESPPVHEKEEERETASKNKKQEQKDLEDQKMEQESSTLENMATDKVDQRVPLKSEVHQLDASVLLDNDTLTPKTEGTDAEDQNVVKNCTDKEIPDHTPTKNKDADPPRVTGNSPPPTPPPAHHPPPPPKKSPTSSISIPSPEEEIQLATEKEYPTMEPSWPPPPPPLDESSDILFEGQDEMDFPPPPPPFPHDSPSNSSQNCSMESTRQGDNIAQEDTSCMPDIANQAAHNSENSGKSLNQSQDKPQSSEKVPQVCQNLICSKIPALPENPSQSSQDVPFQLLPEEIPTPPQQDPPNPQGMSDKDILKHATSEAPAFTTDVATPPPVEDQSTINFRRQPSLTSKDNRSKELLSRHKSAPIPKEDANIPLVTPSLLQMVRLRSVNVEDSVNILSQDCKSDMEGTPGQDQELSSQVIPQKPIRKACLKSTQSSVKSSAAMVLAPSMRLQEAIRMKTAAMSSSGVPARLSPRLPTPTTNSNDTPEPSPKTPDSGDLHKSPASTASFIFSKSTKKVVIETPTSPEVQTTLKQNLAAELMQFSEQAKSNITNETKKHIKVPPPVAKKPAHVTNPSDKLGTESSSSKQKNGIQNGQLETVQPAGQQAQSPRTELPASTTETPSTVEVS